MTDSPDLTDSPRRRNLRPQDAGYGVEDGGAGVDEFGAGRLVPFVADFLSGCGGPAIHEYEVAQFVFLVCEKQEWPVTKKLYEQLVSELLRVRLVTRIKGGKAFALFGHAGAKASEVLCSVDPFVYVSHLSAMEYHGLTDKFPQILYATRPRLGEWRRRADAKMQRDLGGGFLRYKSLRLPRLAPLSLERIGNTAVSLRERTHLGAFKQVMGSPLRVATVGRVFLDMLREPRLCGGIEHVLDVYRKEARQYLRLIVDEVGRHGEAIDKVRAGYVLEVVCGLPSESFKEWKGLSQRGGSRKLDPDAEYSSTFSSQWQLSINVPALASLHQGDSND